MTNDERKLLLMVGKATAQLLTLSPTTSAQGVSFARELCDLCHKISKEHEPETDAALRQRIVDLYFTEFGSCPGFSHLTGLEARFVVIATGEDLDAIAAKIGLTRKGLNG